MNLEQKLSELPAMERSKLRELWLELFGQLPHLRLRREVLVPILAYRLQEKVLGGLKPATAKRLRVIAEQSTAGKEPTRNAMLHPTVGTRIVREWRGRLHEVAVLKNGFEYDGEIYRSLSEIARGITGTRWSGPAFFGLKNRSPKRAA
ncbi:MAG TPA: DUF2924 domain-containing protein [Terracidiphilus sp.]